MEQWSLMCTILTDWSLKRMALYSLTSVSCLAYDKAWFCHCPVPKLKPSPCPGSGGVEVCCHGVGPHPAVRLHGCVYHRYPGRVCWKTHRAQHAVVRERWKWRRPFLNEFGHTPIYRCRWLDQNTGQKSPESAMYLIVIHIILWIMRLISLLNNPRSERPKYISKDLAKLSIWVTWLDVYLTKYYTNTFHICIWYDMYCISATITTLFRFDFIFS